MLATFGVATLALLALPGPTNALFAAAGATAGWRRSLPLLAVAIGAYGMAIGAFTAILGPTGGAYPLLGSLLRLAAGAWLIWSTVRLWQASGQRTAGSAVTPTRLFLTTLLNPKALVLASAIFPSVASTGWLAPGAIFILIVAATGSAWMAIGRLLAETAPEIATPRLVARIAALTMACFAIWVIAWGFAGLIR